MKRRFPHPNGRELRIAAACIDSGAFTDEVYTFCKKRFARRVYAVKGRGGGGLPNIAHVADNNRIKCTVFTLGSDSIKGLVYSRLAVPSPGPGFCHFPEAYDLDYFEQLTAEIAVTNWVKGQPTIQYILREGVRNEALDCRCYNVAALEILRPNWVRLMEKTHAAKESPPQKEARRRGSRGVKRRRRGGWVTNW